MPGLSCPPTGAARHPITRAARAVLLGSCTLIACALTPACSDPPKTAERLDKPLIVRDIPDVLRGTIGAETTLRGIEPVLVSGFGIVVGLNGTGGNALIDPAVQATMERELARGGVTRAPDGNDLGRMGVSPAEFLRSKNVAIVIVEAAIPPAAPRGSTFDVRVRALPNSEVTSLEGGTLWTTDLRIGPATVFEGYKTHRIAQARGQIFVNAFNEPGSAAQSVGQTVGTVIGGGIAMDPLRIQMVLDNDSHSRARSILTAINTRFPEGRRDEGPIATGRDGSSLSIRIPYEYRDRADEFVRLLQATRIDQSQPQEWACRYVEELKQRPELAEPLTWCLRALGDMAVRSGCLHPMYDYPEIGPRLAALEAGAHLGDARAAPYLKELALSGPPDSRAAAIQLMGSMVTNPQVGLTLREMLDSSELDIRISAYEALSNRGDPLIERRVVGSDPGRPRFFLELVPSRDPLIYVTQQGKPRIVLFGGRSIGEQKPLRLNKPLLVAAWSNRLMLMADNPSDPVRMLYQSARSQSRNPIALNNTFTVPDKLVDLIYFFAHESSPDDPSDGLDMTFSEVVGALYEIQRQQGVNALFATETDRLGAAVYQAARSTVIEERPITTEGEDAAQKIITFAPVDPSATPAVPVTKSQEKRSLVKTLPPPVKKN